MKKRKPESMASVLAGWLDQSGLAPRVEQAGVVPEWPSLVGAQIASVTSPTSVAVDGTLFVQVTTHAWMNELSLLEPELLRMLNVVEGRTPIRRIRWLLRREPTTR